MNLKGSIIRSMRRLFRRPSCPVCQKRLKDFIVDIEKGWIRCVYCAADIDPTEVFSDSEILLLAHSISQEHAEGFLKRLGFKRGPIVRTPKILVIFLIAVIILGTFLGVFVAIVHRDSYIGALIASLVGVSIVWQVLRYYREEKQPRWKRK